MPHHCFMLKMIREPIEENKNLSTSWMLQLDISVEQYQVELNLLETMNGVGKDSDNYYWRDTGNSS